MEATDNATFNTVLDKVDGCVGKFARPECVEKVEKLALYKTIIAWAWHKNVSDWVAKNFDTINKWLGIISIVFGALSILSILGLLGVISRFGISYGIFMGITILCSLVQIVLSMAGWVGMLGKRAWVPFLILANFAFGLISQVVLKVIGSFVPMTTTMAIPYVGNISDTRPADVITVSWAISFVIGALIGFIVLAWVIENRKLYTSAKKA